MENESSDKYIHFEGAFSTAVQLLQYNNEYSFGTLNIKKAVEVFKGTIQIPQDFVNKESRIRIEAYSTTQDLGATVWTDGESDTVDFVIYGDTSDFDIYNGDYVFYITRQGDGSIVSTKTRQGDGSIVSTNK